MYEPHAALLYYQRSCPIPWDFDDLKSLFVLSLPRSLSSIVYHAARFMLGLHEPIWTTDGEILNLDRLAHYRRLRIDEGATFTTREYDPHLFYRLTAFVSQVTVAEGFAYKDVVQPFVVSAWPGLSRFGALRIRHNLADVAFSMLAQKWYYPQAALGPIGPGVPPIQPPGSANVSYTPAPSSLDDLEVRVIRGLVLADRALARVDAVTVDYDDLIWNEETLRAALSALYPGTDVSQVRYIDEVFCYRREALLQRRTAPRYRALQQLVAAIEAEPMYSVNR